MILDATILVVDDQKENLFLIRSILTKIGCRVETLEEPTRVIEHIQNTKYDLVILDILMPVINGFELCRLIRKNRDYENTPIMFISALDEEEMIVKAFAIGANDYITKPIKKDEVVARVKNQLVYKNKYNALSTILNFAFHDLLTPLNIIENDTFLLEQRFGENQNLQRISIALQMLQSIYDDMYFSVKQEQIDMQEEYKTNIQNAFKEHLQSLKILTTNKNLTIVLNIPEKNEIFVKLPKLALDRVLLNTLSNAIKYSPNNSTIDIEVKQEEKNTLVAISNFTKSEMNFQKFFQTGLKEHQKIKGAGIGLEIIRKITLDYNIQIDTIQTPEKLTFSFQFPSEFD